MGLETIARVDANEHGGILLHDCRSEPRGFGGPPAMDLDSHQIEAPDQRLAPPPEGDLEVPAVGFHGKNGPVDPAEWIP